MHKSSGNVIWFDDAAETMGADVMRWMYCASKPENDMLFGYTRSDEVKRKFLIPLWNVYSFFVTYANLDKWKPNNFTTQYSLLDRWILSKLQTLIQDVTNHLENYDAFGAAVSLEQFVNELSTWYVRRSRRRFWKSEASDDKRAGYSTLYSCLKTLMILLAPIMPFTAEFIYQKLVPGAEPDFPESVHLNDWPVADPGLIDGELMKDMELAMRVSSMGRAARSKKGIKLRQPLQNALVVADEDALLRLKKLSNLVIEELNVKELMLKKDRSQLMRYQVKPVARILGGKHGRLYPKIVEGINQLSQEGAERLLKEEPILIKLGEEHVEILPEEVDLELVSLPGLSVVEEGDLMVGVSTDISEKLKYEGLARDIVRRIQALRKEADFEIDDRINTYYYGDPEVLIVFEKEGMYISMETLSVELRAGKAPENAYTSDFDIDGLKLRLGLIKVEQ